MSEIKEVKKFVIDREIWSRGKPNSALLIGKRTAELLADKSVYDGEGCKCCLGIYLTVCGVSDEVLSDVGEPIELSEVAQQEALEGGAGSWLFAEEDRNSSSITVAELIEINDDEEISETSRERSITALFLSQGIEVEFKN